MFAGEDDSRLSDLPDSILHHILSFLGTQSSVRTSILSKRWADVWKGVNVLDLQASSFLRKSSLEKLLSSLRSHRTIAGNISFRFWEGLDRSRRDVKAGELFDMLMAHAAAGSHDHHCHLQVLSIRSCYVGGSISESITRHHHRESLATLKVEDTDFGCLHALLCAGFTMLTTLELRRCVISPIDKFTNDRVICDPFGGLPSLSNLKLLECSSGMPFGVRGRQLLKLEIRCDPDAMGYGKLGIGELSAPKLESLYISGYAYDVCGLEEVWLPCLAQASVRLKWHRIGSYLRNRDEGKFERVGGAFMWLLRGMNTAESLELGLDSFVGQDSPLAGMKPWIEDELSRFTRLKTLKVQYPRESPSICNYMKALSLYVEDTSALTLRGFRQ